MKLIYASILALGFLAAPGFAGEYGGCHSCSSVTVTSTVTTDGNRASDRVHAYQPGGSCNWVNCKVESAMLKGSGPDPVTRTRTRTFEVCEPKEVKAL